MNMEKQYQLPKEFATKWVEALRSGEYAQAKGILKKGNSYCCLGVACIIQNATPKQINHSGYIPLNGKINVPDRIKGVSSGNSLVFKLTDLNDTGKSFTEIANWIEENVEFI